MTNPPISKSVLWQIAGVLILGGGLLLLVNPFGWGDSNEVEHFDARAASVVLIEGTLEQSTDQGANYSPVAEGAVIAEGTYLRTASTGSRSIVAVDGGSSFRLDANTVAIVHQLDAGNITIEVKDGRVYSLVNSESALAWQVTALNTKATAFGTAYSVACNQKDQLVDVEVIESQVHVESQNGESESLQIVVDAGEQVTIDEKKEISEAVSQTELTVSEVAKDVFLTWNAQVDPEAEDVENVKPVEDVEIEKETEEAEKVVEAPKPVAKSASIYLKASASADGVYLKWSLENGASSDEGFKIVKSSKANPTYPENSYQFLSAETRSYTWGLKDGETYHFRVCVYNGSGCGLYSNDVTVTTVKKTSSESTKSDKSGYESSGSALQASVTTADGKAKVTWSASSDDDFQGYKVVRSSSDSDPYYPKSGYLSYIQDRSTTKYLDSTAEVGESYYYRVCSLQSDGPVACGNVVKVTVE